MEADRTISNSYTIKPIGVVHSDFKNKKEVSGSKIKDNIGQIEIFKEYEDGLSDLEGFSHIVVIFWMHKSSFKSFKVRPICRPEKFRGVFATKHPDRPNPLGITVVELLARQGNILRVKGVDMIDGSPVLDIKPYTRDDQKNAAAFGWI